MSHLQASLKEVASKVFAAKSLLLTTHKMCDGDGLGSLLAFHHAFSVTKTVRSIVVDKISDKYHFLSPEKYIDRFDQLKTPIEPMELALIFDTNDNRRVQPFYEELKKKCQEIIYIDHHPILENGPKPSEYSVIDTTAASTGQICYFLLKEMGIAMNKKIATALYTSIVFDTQRFQFIKNSGVSHTICADLCNYIENNELIYHYLFGINSLEKINLLSYSIKQTEYFHQNKVAILEMSKKKLDESNLNIEDACDFLDINLAVDSTQVSVLIVNLSDNKYKLSFRSKNWDILKLAEIFNGGGHKNSSGATLIDYAKNPKAEVLKALSCFINSGNVK